MYDYTDQPPHFFYIHFLVLLSALYLPLFAIDNLVELKTSDFCVFSHHLSKLLDALADLGLDILNGVIVFLQVSYNDRKQ